MLSETVYTDSNSLCELYRIRAKIRSLAVVLMCTEARHVLRSYCVCATCGMVRNFGAHMERYVLCVWYCTQHSLATHACEFAPAWNAAALGVCLPSSLRPRWGASGAA